MGKRAAQISLATAVLVGQLAATAALAGAAPPTWERGASIEEQEAEDGV